MPQETRQHPDKPDYFQVFKQVGIPTEFRKVRPDLCELYQYHTKPIAILGGGPSLPEDLKKVKGCILMSANHHALRLTDVDYMVFQDAPESRAEDKDFVNAVTHPQYIRISPRIKHTDYYVVNEYPFKERISDSGRFAVWVASYITSGDIYLCGIGLREENQPEHFYELNYERKAWWGGPTKERKIEQWINIIKQCENSKRIKAVSGPLSELLPLKNTQ